MPKVKGPLFSVNARKSLGKTLTYQGRPGGTAVYPYKKPKVPLTDRQLRQRDLIKWCVYQWQQLSDGTKAEWEARAKGQGQSGYSYFLKHKRGFWFDPDVALYLPLYDERLKGDKFLSMESHGHLSQATGSVWQPNGRLFNGVGDFLNLGQHAGFDITEAITVWGWCKRTASTSGTLAGRYDSADNAKKAWVIRWIDNNYIYWQPAGRNTYKNIPVADRDWHHFVGTYDRVIAKFYVDAVFALSDEGTDPILTPAVDVLVGASFNAAPTTIWHFPGLIGEVGVLDGVDWSQEDVEHNYLVNKWRFP